MIQDLLNNSIKFFGYWCLALFVVPTLICVTTVFRMGQIVLEAGYSEVAMMCVLIPVIVWVLMAILVVLYIGLSLVNKKLNEIKEWIKWEPRTIR